MQHPHSRRFRASSFLPALRSLLGAGVFLAILPPAVAADIGRQAITGSDYDTVRQFLIEAIEFEGLVPGPVSQFGELLHRTDADLRHGGDVYARAEVLSFCSVAVAAQLVREDPERIADCPMTIALYSLKDSPEIRIAYRRREGSTPGSEAANGLLRRIVERTMAMLPRSGER